jgi:hypothetical protein
MGVVLTGLGQLDRAVEIFERVLSVDLAYPHARGCIEAIRRLKEDTSSDARPPKE